MDDILKEKEKTLERLHVDKEIASEEAAIAEKKALEAKLKKEYGTNWKKILGVVKGIKPNREAIQDLYSVSPELRELGRPPKMNLR